MSAVQPTQVFYSLSLTHSSAPTAATLCNVIPGLKPNDQQVFEARGSRVYIRRIIEGAPKQDDPSDRHPSTILTVLEQDVFSIIRGVGALRIPGSNIGRIGLYSYDGEDNRLKQVHLETFGKSGVRRTIPGQYLAVDPRGRCLMMASTEKNKLVYIFQRLPDGSINISSPHEANTWSTLTFDLCPLHVGWEHPIFATLEVDYSECESDDTGIAYENREKVLSFYTVDLGLNHVVRTWSEQVDYTANKLFGVPGGTDGPSGVLVCARGRIYYKHEKFPGMSIAIPRRTGPLEDPQRDRIIVSGSLVHHKAQQTFYFLLQTDDGDIFKLSMEFEDETSWIPVLLRLRYWDTTPLATTMLATRRGHLFVGAEHGDTKLYKIQKVDDDADFEPDNIHTSEDISADHMDKLTPTTFRHRELEHVSEMQSLPALHPLIRTRLEKLIDNSDSPQILALQGTGNASRLKMIQHGISTDVDHSFKTPDHTFDRIFTIPAARDEQLLTKYIVCSASHEDKTLVLEIEGDDISSMDNTPFIQNRSTILALLMGESTNIQVHARGIHSILESGKINEWRTPAHRTISCAAGNDRQLLVGLSSGEAVFFFMTNDGVLSELEDQLPLDSRINCMAMGATPVGQTQAKFAVVGTDDCLIRIISITLDAPLQVVGIQAVREPPASIVVVDMPDPDSGTTVTVVHIGLVNGVYLRGTIDEVTGELSNVRTRVVGTEPVRIFAVDVHDQQCVVLCTSKVWIGFHHPVTKQYTLTPLVDDPLDAAACLYTAERISLCGCAGTELRFFRPGPLDQRFVTDEIKLQYTPRNLTRHPTESILYVIQSDANTLDRSTALRVLEEKGLQSTDVDLSLTNARAAGYWASCVQVVDPIKGKAVVSTLYFEAGEAALSCAVVQFESKDNLPFLVVGTGSGMHGAQTAAGQPGGFVHVYQISEDGRSLTHLHKTAFERPIYALAAFRGRLAMGIGNEIFIYDLGNAHILRKSRGFGGVPNTIVTLTTMGNRIICGDISESVTYVVYNEDFNRLVPFVDDTVSRWTTAIGLLDYDTVAGGDKFGNLWIMRCPEDISRESDDQGLNGYIMNERPYMGGTPYRLENRAHFFCQDIPMSIQKVSMGVGGAEVLFWSGVQGTMGILVPFVSRNDVTFFTQLEIQMRQEHPPLTGRDHLAYRGYYSPVRAVVDGDLCERFMELSYDKKQKIAAEVDREIPEIEKKIQEMRTNVAF